MSTISHPLICSGCWTRTSNMHVQNKRTGLWMCFKCYRRECVKNRPKAMSIREAFHNLVHHGTFTPEKKIDPKLASNKS